MISQVPIFLQSLNRQLKDELDHLGFFVMSPVCVIFLGKYRRKFGNNKSWVIYSNLSQWNTTHCSIKFICYLKYFTCARNCCLYWGEKVQRKSFLQGFGDILVSKGSIVVISYLLAEDGPDPDYPDVIVANMMRVFTKVGLSYYT